MVVTSTDQKLEITIRTFNFPDDYPAVYDLWFRSGPGIQLRRSDTESEISKKLLRDPELFLLAEASDRVIGSVIGGFDGRRGMVYHLAVEPEFRKKGIGTTLMRALEERFREIGCIRYYLLVTRDNIEALKFYEKLGCQRMELHAYAKNLD